MLSELVISMAPTLLPTFFMDLVKAILHSFAIFSVGGMLQALTEFVFPILKSLAMLPAVMVVPLALTISGRGCLAVTRRRRLVTGRRWRLAVSRHCKLTNPRYCNLRLSMSLL